MSQKVNKSLFLLHYLTHRLSDHDEWRADAAPALATMQALYQQKKDVLPTFNEAQTEQEFIQRILETVLGFDGAYSVQTAVHQHGRIQRPDYALFANAAGKTEADQHLGDETTFYSRVVAVADAKYWERPLSEIRKSDARDHWQNNNPSFQIVNYLTATKVNWGILTNGRIWRLYSRHVSGIATEYYEIDLVDILENNPGDFKRFWLFFRRQAFTPDTQGRNFLDRVREGSATYARVVGDTLKARVFDQIFPLLAGGFVADMAWRGQDPTTDVTRKRIYEAALSLLYKLLFLFYGEARDLLPIHHRGYRAKSLTYMAQEMAGLLDRREPLGETVADFYGRFLSLCQLIDRGDTGLSLPRYNGGLFHFDFRDPKTQEKHATNYFLTQHTINDKRLAQALDLLARIDGEVIDYGDLGVRHLGGIYEGLLEYKLIVDDSATGKVHLENDKGERKATGSYYTPDYIVKYIVRHTLEPILEKRWQKFDDLMTRIVTKRKRLAELEVKLVDQTASLSPSVQSRYKNEQHVLRRELDPLERDARETVLDIKVCDPAMGSGHFLVEVVDYLTTNLITILNDYPEHNPALDWLARIRESILAAMAEQGISIDAERLNDTQLLQRAVMKRCIYGVDLNQMAVELAKVSLWLHTFTVGAPLSFLDHHLRWGNSLVGAMAKEAALEMTATPQPRKISKAAQILAAGRGEQLHEEVASYQFNIFSGPFRGLLQAANIMRGISLLSDATLEEVEKSETLFHEFDREAIPYKRLLDVYVSRHFGVKQADEFLRLYGVDALKAEPEKLGKLYKEVLMAAQALFSEKRFFHWDLEFPEVFIDLDRADWKANGGFDAVVGNPPWLGVRTGLIDKHLLTWCKQNYVAAVGQFDLASVFLELSNRLLAQLGIAGVVVPKRIATNESYANLRQAVVIDRPLLVAIDLGVAFDGVNNDAMILINGHSRGETVTLGIREGKSVLVEWQIKRKALNKMPFLIIPINSRTSAISIVEKMGSISLMPVKDLVTIQRGSECGMNHFSIKQGPQASGIRLVNHLDVDRYSVDYSGWRIDPSKIDERKLKPVALYQTVPKLLIRFLSSELIVSKDTVGYASTNLIYHVHLLKDVPISINFLCALLNSKLLSFWYITAFQNDEVKFPHVQISHLKSLPICKIKFTTTVGEKETAIIQAKQLYQEALDDGDSATFAPLLNQTFKPDVVHDLLAFLAEEMIRLNKEKQAEISNFLDWLAEYTELPLDEWQLKTIIRAYYETGWQEFRRALKRNEKKITAVDVNSRAALTRLKKEYDASMSTLSPLLTTITATDRLIDQIVYQLYGLTDEEIAIVEGKQ